MYLAKDLFQSLFLVKIDKTKKTHENDETTWDILGENLFQTW